MKMKGVIFPAIAFFIVGSLVGYFGFLSLQYAYLPDDDLSKYTGKIIKKGEYEKTSPLRKNPSTGERERKVQKFYYIKLEGLDGRLITYNLEQRYYKIDRELNLGDIVTVSYLPIGYDLALETLKKGDQIILEESRLWAKILGFIALIVTIILFIRVYSLLKKRPIAN